MNRLKLSFVGVCAIAMLSVSINSQATTNNYDGNVYRLTSAEEEPVAKTSKKKKKNTKGVRNNKVVKIYPDIIKREMHVVAKDSDGKTVDFFVFDTAGTMVQQYKMNERDHKRITGLQPGKYTYRVFTGDTETDFGTFEIK